MAGESLARTIANLGATDAAYFDIEHIAALALDHLQSAVGAEFLALALRDAPQLPPDFSAAWKGNRLEHDTLKPVETPLIERAMVSQQAAVYSRQNLEIGGPGAVVALPLLARGQSIGSLTLAWQDSLPERFDLQAAQLLATILGLTLQNARLHQSQQYYIQALEYLGGLSGELNLLSNPAEVITRVEHIACALMNVERCAVFLTRGEIITSVSSFGLSSAFADSLQGADLKVWSLGQSLEASHVAVFADPARIPEDGPWRETLKREGVQAGMMTLLQGHLRVLGYITLYYDTPYTPSPQEIRLLEILASQLAVALDNIELNEANELHAEGLEQRVAERTQELAVALDKAEDADRLKTQLLSTVSHELRTPLSVIKTHATMVLHYYDRLPKERQLSYVHIIDEEADRLTTLISNLLDMSRLEAGRLEIKRVSTDPTPLLANLRDLLQTRFPDREFQWSITPELRPILADPERTRQVIENLVENAVKYSPPQTQIEIGTRVWDDALEIWVRDQGYGLTREQVRQVFESFYQVNSGNSHQARSGVGLGLAICKALVEEMKGRIWCESAGLNKGSKFAFTLPWANKA